MRDHLIKKNVAVDIADAVCQTVGEQLVGQTCGTFTSISRKVKDVPTRLTLQLNYSDAQLVHKVGGENFRPGFCKKINPGFSKF